MTEKDEKEDFQEFIYSQLTNTWVYNPYFLDQTVQYIINLEDE